MTKKLRYIGISGMALLFCLVCLMGAFLSPRAESADPFHYGIAGVESNETVAPSVLFTALLGSAPTASEAAYLDRVSGLSLTYNAVPDATKTWVAMSKNPVTIASQTANKYITVALVNKQTGFVVSGGNTQLVVKA